MAIFTEDHPQRSDKVRHSPVASENMTNYFILYLYIILRMHCNLRSPNATPVLCRHAKFKVAEPIAVL